VSTNWKEKIKLPNYSCLEQVVVLRVLGVLRELVVLDSLGQRLDQLVVVQRRVRVDWRFKDRQIVADNRLADGLADGLADRLLDQLLDDTATNWGGHADIVADLADWGNSQVRAAHAGLEAVVAEDLDKLLLLADGAEDLRDGVGRGQWRVGRGQWRNVLEDRALDQLEDDLLDWVAVVLKARRKDRALDRLLDQLADQLLNREVAAAIDRGGWVIATEDELLDDLLHHGWLEGSTASKQFDWEREFFRGVVWSVRGVWEDLRQDRAGWNVVLQVLDDAADELLNDEALRADGVDEVADDLVEQDWVDSLNVAEDLLDQVAGLWVDTARQNVAHDLNLWGVDTREDWRMVARAIDFSENRALRNEALRDSLAEDRGVLWFEGSPFR